MTKARDLSAGVQRRSLLKLRDTTAEQIANFQSAYVDQVIARPLLTDGMLLSSKDEVRAARHAGYIILISDALSPFQRLVTLFHELIHVQLLMVGVPAEAHDELAIDEAATSLAKRFPDFPLRTAA